MEGGGGSFSVVFRRLGQGRVFETRWDEEMATFACAAGLVSRAVGMGWGVESSRVGLGGFPVVFWFLLEIVVLVFERCEY